MQDPLKQGLKLFKNDIVRLHYEDSNARSTKTRIETKDTAGAGPLPLMHSNARSTKTRIETNSASFNADGHNRIRMQDPLKQGLKLTPSEII